MAFFSRRTLVAVLATSAAVMTCDAFSSSPSSSMSRTLSSIVTRTTCRSTPVPPLLVSLSTAMEDDIATSDDDDDAQDYLLESSDLLSDGDESSNNDEVMPASYVSRARIAELRAIHRRHETDVGSPEYQVAGMTERISHLTSHLRAHPKDFSTRRGLVALVNKRRRLLNYLYRTDETGYAEIVSSLGIRHRVPGAIPSREDQYGEYPGQKANRGKSKMKGNKRN
ncbi:hypothetical protein ACHAXA_011696 [Cyclostephanos tholiformis]|uniref:30S ribosomal protein S15 n=1 Tax=Cyclostephanos tholiformis TaxID=382380 RepID=A0ABD3SCJ1_9STRA